MAAAASSSGLRHGDLHVTVNRDTFFSLQYAEKSEKSGKYSLSRDGHIFIHLDKLSETELRRREMSYGFGAVNFRAVFDALPQNRHQEIVKSLVDADLHQEQCESFSRRYKGIFDKYALAHNSAQVLVEADIAKPVPVVEMPNMKQFLSMRGQQMPVVTVNCGRSEMPAAAAAAESLDVEGAPAGESVPVDFMLAAAHSPVILRMSQAGMKESVDKRIELNWDVPKSTVEKVIGYMYDHAPIQIESDEEALALYNIAHPYEIDGIVVQCAPRAKRALLSQCHPDLLISPDRFAEKLKAKKTGEIFHYYNGKKNCVAEFVQDYLSKILPPVLQAAAKGGASAAGS